jgi:hypothetical protein
MARPLWMPHAPLGAKKGIKKSLIILPLDSYTLSEIESVVEKKHTVS